MFKSVAVTAAIFVCCCRCCLHVDVHSLFCSSAASHLSSQAALREKRKREREREQERLYSRKPSGDAAAVAASALRCAAGRCCCCCRLLCSGSPGVDSCTRSYLPPGCPQQLISHLNSQVTSLTTGLNGLTQRSSPKYPNRGWPSVYISQWRTTALRRLSAVSNTELTIDFHHTQCPLPATPSRFPLPSTSQRVRKATPACPPCG